MMEFGEKGELLGALVGAVGWQIDLLIPAEQAGHGAEIMGAFEFGDETLVGGGNHDAMQAQPERIAKRRIVAV